MSLIDTSRSDQGSNQGILNKQLKETYHRQLQHLVYKRSLTLSDRLQLVCYLLMQERVAEAKKLFAKVKEDEVS